MFRLLRVLIVLLLVFGLFSLIGTSSYRSGWWQGYTAGQVDSTGEDGGTAAPQYGPGAFGRYGPGIGLFGPFFWGFGLLFKFGFFLLLFGLIGKMFFFRRWRHGKGPHGHWGPRDGEPHEKQPEDVEPDVATT